MSRRKQKKNDDEDNGFAQWGGYMDAKIQKLEKQFATNAAHNPYKKSDLFAGISIFVNGLTQPSADELKRIMMAHGGIYHTYYRSGVTTYIIASQLPDVKIRQMRASRTIIRADWVVDCLCQQRIVDYAQYLLFSDSTSAAQPKLNFAKKSSSSTTMTTRAVVKLNLEEVAQKLTTDEPTSRALVGCEPPKDDDDDDEDMFADTGDDNGNDCASSSASPLALQTNKDDDDDPLKTATELNQSFNIADNLNFLNIQLRSKKPPSSDADTIAAAKNASTSVVQKPTIVPEKPTTSSTKTAGVRTAVDPNFLAEFYNNSRLHHIATLGASFKNHISLLREAADEHKHFPARQSIITATNNNASVSTTSSTVMHIDMDCFFVSVGLRSRPHLRGRPVAVTHSKSGATGAVRAGADPQREHDMWAQRHRSANGLIENRVALKTGGGAQALQAGDSLAEIASCSYEARACGLRNGMFVGAALKMCPDLCTIPYDFEAYKAVAQQLYDTVVKYTLDIEAVSCDEMYVELQDILTTTGLTADAFVNFLRKEIATLTGCPCSAGIGANRLQARMATKRAKPDGQFWLRSDQVATYFADIELAQLPGIGYTTQQKLSQLGWRRCGDLYAIGVARLQTEFGRKLGETLYDSCRGVDRKPLVYGQQRKSVSAEVNYGIRFAQHAELDTFLRQLCVEVHNRLMECRRRGKSVTLKLMVRAADAPVETAKFLGHGVCDSISKSCTLAEPTSDAGVIEDAVFRIRRGLTLTPEDVRGVGIQIGKLVACSSAAADAKSEPAQGGRLKEMFARAPKPKDKATPAVVKDAVPMRAQLKESVPAPKSPPKTRMLRRNRAISLDAMPAKRKRALSSKANAKVNTIRECVINMGPRMMSAEFQQGAEIDLAFLSELPDDIREEVLRQHRFQSHRSHQSSVRSKEATKVALTVHNETSLDSDFLRALPADIRQELIDNEKRERAVKRRSADETTLGTAAIAPKVVITADDTGAISVAETEPEENVLLLPDWRNMLAQWLASVVAGDAPIECDIDTIAEYACQMVCNRKLLEVSLRMRFLHRIINERCDPIWCEVYRRIAAAVQLVVQTEFNGKLQLNESFRCES